MEQRHPKYPDVPTFKELGFDLVSGAYRGIAVPAGTPDDVKQKLADMIGQINADPEFQKKMVEGGFALVDVPVEKNAEFMKQKSEEFIAAAKEGGILN
jgi:tripartite-type tricarboxylate transporter receptor subunit TctC